MASLIGITVDEPRYCPAIRFAQGASTRPIRLTAGPNLERLESGMIPNEAFLESEHEVISDFVPINGRLSVCSEVRALIEALEPGIHQFFPVRIIRRRDNKPIYRLDGRELDEPYYYFHVQCMLDAVCIEQSHVKVTQTVFGSSSMVHKVPGHYSRIVLYKDVVAGHHLWRGQYQLPDDLFFSDFLVGALKKGNFQKLQLFNLREV